MTIFTTDTKKLIEITLKFWDGSQWSCDQFDDLEPNFPQKHCYDDDYNIIATQKEVDDLVDWWEAETKVYNNGGNSEIFGSIDENREIEEWLLEVFID